MTTAVQQLIDSFDALSDTEKQEAATELLRRAPWMAPCGRPAERVAGLHAGAIQPASDFDAPLPDDFWTGQT
jgi:hypothetical protein